MTAGDKGVQIVCNAGGYSMMGATASLLAAPGKPGKTGQPLTLGPLAVSQDGLSATYVTTGTDFLQGGPWQLQLVVQPLGGQAYTSPRVELWLNPLL